MCYLNWVRTEALFQCQLSQQLRLKRFLILIHTQWRNLQSNIRFMSIHEVLKTCSLLSSMTGTTSTSSNTKSSNSGYSKIDKRSLICKKSLGRIVTTFKTMKGFSYLPKSLIMSSKVHYRQRKAHLLNLIPISNSTWAYHCPNRLPYPL